MDTIKTLFLNCSNKIPDFSLEGLNTYVRVCSVTDGDTIKVIMKLLDKQYFKFIIRLNGIDTSETKSKSDKLKQIAIKAKERLFQLLTNNKLNSDWKKKDIEKYFDDNICIVKIHCYNFDKYGRILADIYLLSNDNINEENLPRKSLSEILISENLAYKYEGDTKLSEEEQLKLLIN